MAPRKTKVPVLEEFVSIQGEGRNLGLPYYFIRVAGCPLRCNFCDTERSWKANADQMRDVDEVARKAFDTCEQHGIEWVSFTGGEPMLYTKQMMRMMDLWDGWSDGRYKVHIETSGRFHDLDMHSRCDIYSVDAKTPCTGESIPEFFKGMDHMRSVDQAKCLIHNEADLDFAHKVNIALEGRCTMVLQPFNTAILTDSTKNMQPMMAAARINELPATHNIRRGVGVGLRNLLQAFHRRCGEGEKWLDTIITPQVHVIAYGNEAGT
tara:strand:- start:1781 stop:2575 length:795 start_codon:yes stop_codon:yes gene_type:complete